MLSSRRFELTLVLALLPLIVMAATFAMTPTGALTLAGNPGSHGARLSGTQLVIDGLGLYGSHVDGVEVTHFEIGELETLSQFVIERDFRPSTIIPGTPTWTIRMAIPQVSAMNGLDLYTSNSCLGGIGLTNFGLLEGLLDPFINEMVADGYHPNILTFLINIIGPTGLINFTVADLKSEIMILEAGTLTTSGGMTLTVTPQQVDPVFQGSCL